MTRHEDLGWVISWHHGYIASALYLWPRRCSSALVHGDCLYEACASHASQMENLYCAEMKAWHYITSDGSMVSDSCDTDRAYTAEAED